MNICVIGGGPAGMIAAVTAAEAGNKVILIEQNEKLGKKLFLTGKGRCNITNSCDMEELFDNVIHNPKFLYSAFYSFDNTAVMDYFESSGLKLKVERGNRVFPLSDHSSDVIKTLSKRLEKANVKVLLNSKVSKICTEEDTNKISGVILKDNQYIHADRIIMATGGKSYPTTGSDGSALNLLDGFDIRINKFMPSLVPMESSDKYVKDMQGLSLKNVSAQLYVGKKCIYSGFGEMLFTHFGISGPLVLSGSAYLRENSFDEEVRLDIDLKPALSCEELDKRILNDFSENSNKIFENVLSKLLPGKMISTVIYLSQIPKDKRVNLITKEERRKLVEVVKKIPVHVTGTRGFNEAIISRGGVNIKDINPSTMECKKVKGLYFAGEMIDCDAFTGGFNLQIAWSTGYLAGMSAGSLY